LQQTASNNNKVLFHFKTYIHRRSISSE